MFAHVCRVDIHAQARAGWDSDSSIDNFERRCFALKLHTRSQTFELVMRHCIGKSRNKMHHEAFSEPPMAGRY